MTNTAGPGRFITLEGGEGAGKTTHARRLAEALRGRGMDVVLTREPGGASGAEEIRRLLVEGAPARWEPLTETLLHFAARREHVCRCIRPALERGAWVVCDRFVDSTMAYQGYGLGLGRAPVEALAALTLDGLRPDLTLVFDLPVADGLARAADRGGLETRYERMDLAFHERLRAGFLDIARREPDRCVVIDARPLPDVVAADILAAVGQHLDVP